MATVSANICGGDSPIDWLWCVPPPWVRMAQWLGRCCADCHYSRSRSALSAEREMPRPSLPLATNSPVMTAHASVLIWCHAE